jgi:hypothetical protein
MAEQHQRAAAQAGHAHADVVELKGVENGFGHAVELLRVKRADSIQAGVSERFRSVSACQRTQAGCAGDSTDTDTAS